MIPLCFFFTGQCIKKIIRKWKDYDNLSRLHWMSLAAFRVTASVARERSQRREWQNLFDRPQINDSSVQQQCAEGHFRKHISFNLELDGLKQQRAATFHSSQQRTRKWGYVCHHQNCMTVEWKNKAWSEKSWWTYMGQCKDVAYVVTVRYLNEHMREDKMSFHMHTLLQDSSRHDSDLCFPPIAQPLFIS